MEAVQQMQPALRGLGRKNGSELVADTPGYNAVLRVLLFYSVINAWDVRVTLASNNFKNEVNFCILQIKSKNKLTSILFTEIELEY